MLLLSRALIVGVFLHRRCSLAGPTTKVSVQKPSEALARLLGEGVGATKFRVMALTGL